MVIAATTHERVDAILGQVEKVATPWLFLVADVTAFLIVGINSVLLSYEVEITLQLEIDFLLRKRIERRPRNLFLSLFQTYLESKKKMPRIKQCKNLKSASSKRDDLRSFLSTLRRLVSMFQCTGKNSVRVQPEHISVRPATATVDVRDGDLRPKTPSVFFSSSSRPSTAIRPTTKDCSRPSTRQQPIQVSIPLVGTDHASVSDMNAASGNPISVGGSMQIPASSLPGLSPSPATIANDAWESSGELLEDKLRGPSYFRTTLTQIRKMQRQKKLEERRKREEMFGKRPRKVTFNPILEEELKPKKKLSEQIRDEEAAIKEMQQMLVDLDQDETDVLKKMQELNNWRIKIQKEKDYDKHVKKDCQLNEVILILEDRLHILKNTGEKIEAKVGYRRENLIQLQAEYELLLASGSSEEEFETKELLKQFLPTLGISPDNFTIAKLDDVLNEDEEPTPRPDSQPPRCKNPVAAQLLGETSRVSQQTSSMAPLQDIINEYRHTLKRDLALIKKSDGCQKNVNDGMKKFMMSQMESGSGK